MSAKIPKKMAYLFVVGFFSIDCFFLAFIEMGFFINLLRLLVSKKPRRH